MHRRHRRSLLLLPLLATAVDDAMPLFFACVAIHIHVVSEPPLECGVAWIRDLRVRRLPWLDVKLVRWSWYLYLYFYFYL